jgi:hypothetical protein
MNKKRTLIALITGALLLILLLYIFFLRKLVESAYLGETSPIVNTFIEIFYPRFFIERHRFPLDFFLSRTDQIIFRLFFISAILLSGWYLISVKEDIKTGFIKFWNRNIHTGHTGILRILYFSLLIIIFHDIYQDLMRLETAKIFYKPVWIYKLLNIPFPSEEGILIICILFFLSSLLAVFNKLPLISSSIAALLFIIIQGVIFSFEKFDHGFATFTYAGMLMPFLLYERKIASKKGSEVQQGWPLVLIAVCICLSYLYSGLEKIFISNWDWINGNSLKSHLVAHGITAGKFIADNRTLLIIFSNLTLLIQIGFISILFREKLKYVFIPAGILFHLSTYFFLGVGGFLNPWILTYIFFLKWKDLK